MLELVGFHALGELDGDPSMLLESALHEIEVAYVRQRKNEILIGSGAQVPLNLTWPARPTRLEFAVGPVERAAIESWGAADVAEVLKHLWSRTGVELGRSFRGGGAGHGIVLATELGGTLEFVDWIQYLSPRLASRWPRDLVQRAPFYRVEAMDNGGWFLWLGPEPFDGLMSRRAVAEHLGIRLRPLLSKDMSGRTVELNWP